MQKDNNKSNYDIMRDQMEIEFAKYDQEEMIRKFDLKHDGEYIYIRFVGKDYRVDRTSGKVQWLDKNNEYIHANYTESMVIFDMLAYSKPYCTLGGKFVRSNDLKDTVKSSSPDAGVFKRQGDAFVGKTEELREACLKLGGVPGKVGDVSSTIPMFDFFPVVIQFWDKDDEFDAVLKFMWDINSTDFMHYETIAFATGHLVSRLKEVMAEGE